jgi:hypothetical protein
MIVFELKCAKNHRFEGWFRSGDDFESQRGRGILACPTCGSSSVTKFLTAKVRKSAEGALPLHASAKKHPDQVPVAAFDPKAVMAFIEHVLTHTEDVGKQFTQEARRIHRNESPERAIRGHATVEQVEELLDEGIVVLPLPIPTKEEWH